MKNKKIMLKLKSFFIIFIIIGSTAISIFSLGLSGLAQQSNYLFYNNDDKTPEKKLMQNMNDLYFDFLDSFPTFNNINDFDVLGNDSIFYNITEDENETIISYTHPIELYSQLDFPDIYQSLAFCINSFYSEYQINSFNIYEKHDFYDKEEIINHFLQSLNNIITIGINKSQIDSSFKDQIEKILNDYLSNNIIFTEILWMLEDGTTFISVGLFCEENHILIADSFLITIPLCSPTEMRIPKDPIPLKNLLPSSEKLLATAKYSWWTLLCTPFGCLPIYRAFDVFDLYAIHFIVDPYIPIDEIGEFNFTFYVKHSTDRFFRGYHWEAVPLTKLWGIDISNDWGDKIQINSIDDSIWPAYDNIINNDTSSVTIDFSDLGLDAFIFNNPNHDYKILTQNNFGEQTVTTNYISIFGKINTTSSSEILRKLNVRFHCSTELPFIPTGFDFWLKVTTPNQPYFDRGVYYVADNNNTPSISSNIISSVDKNIKFNVSPKIKNERFHTRITSLKLDLDISNESALEDITDSTNPYGPSNAEHEISINGLSIEPGETFRLDNLYSLRSLDYSNVTLDMKIIGWEYELASIYIGMSTKDSSGFRSILVVDRHNLTISPQAFPDFLNYFDEFGDTIIRVEPGTNWTKIANIKNVGLVDAKGIYLDIRRLSDNEIVGFYDSQNHSFPVGDSIAAGSSRIFYITCNDTRKGLNTEYYLTAQLYYEIDGENRTSAIINFTITSKFTLSIDLFHYPRITAGSASYFKLTSVSATIENLAEYSDLNFSIYRNLAFTSFFYPGKTIFASLADILSQATSTALGIAIDGHASLMDVISAVLDMAFYLGLSRWLYRDKLLSLPIGHTDIFNLSIEENSSYSIESSYHTYTPHWVISQLDFDRDYEFGNPLSYVGQGFKNQWFALDFFGEAFDRFGNTFDVEGAEVFAPTEVPPTSWDYKDWGDALGLLAISYLWIGIIFTALFVFFVAMYIASYGINLQAVQYAAECLMQLIYRFGGMGALTGAASLLYIMAADADPEKNDEPIIPIYNNYSAEIPNLTSSTLLKEDINNMYKLEGDIAAFNKSYGQLYNASEEGDYERTIEYANLSEHYLDSINEDLLNLADSTDNLYEEDFLPTDTNITDVLELLEEDDFLNETIDKLKEEGYSDFEVNMSLDVLNRSDPTNTSRFLSNYTLLKNFDYLTLHTMNHVVFNLSQNVNELKINASLKRDNETIKTANPIDITKLKNLTEQINNSIDNGDWLAVKNYSEELLSFSNEIIENTYNKSYLIYKNFATSRLILYKDAMSVHASSTTIDATPNSKPNSILRIKNTGKIKDTYKIKFFDDDPSWDINNWMNNSLEEVTLNPNEIKYINVSINVPETYNFSKPYNFKINVSSVNFSGIFDIAETHIRIHNFTSYLNKPTNQVIEPGGLANYSITIENYGNRNETIYIMVPNIESISTRPTSNWLNYEQKITVMPGETKNTSIFIFPPKECTTNPGNYSLEFIISSEFMPSLRHNQTGKLTILDTEFYLFDAGICKYPKVVTPGDTIACGVWIKNWGSRNDTYNINIEGIDQTWWTISSPVTIAPCNNLSLTFEIHPPRDFNISPGQYFFNLTIQSQKDLALTRNFTRSFNITSFIDLEVAISPSSQVTIPYSVIIFQIQIRNLGNVKEDFNISIGNLQESWYTINSSVTLDPGQYKFLFLEIVPPNIIPSIYEFEINVTSKTNLDVYKTILGSFEMLPAAGVEVFISPDNKILNNGSIFQGVPANFSLEIVNKGNIPDIFDVKILSLGNLQFYANENIINTGLLQPSEKFFSHFYIYGPIDAELNFLFTPGEYLIHIQARSQYNSSVFSFDQSLLKMGDVQIFRNFSAKWINQTLQQVIPGDFIVYPFIVLNQGNTWDVYNVSIKETNGLNPLWFKLSTENQTFESNNLLSLTINPDINASIFLNISLPIQPIPVGFYNFSINIQSSINPNVTLELSAILEVIPTFGIDANISPNNLNIYDDEIAVFNVTITNLGTIQDTFLLNLSKINIGLPEFYWENGTGDVTEIKLESKSSVCLLLKIIPSELGENSFDINISSQGAMQMGYFDIWTILHASIAVYDDDASPPVINVTYIGENTDGNSGHWMVSAIDNESGIEKIIISIDNSEPFEIGNGVMVDVPNDLGNHYITVITYNGDFDRGEEDQENNTKSDNQIIVDDDISPPVISDLWIDDNTTTVLLSFQAFDESGISNFEFIIDGEIVQPINNSSVGNEYTFEFNNEWILEYGLHNVIIDITDGDNDRMNDSLSTTVEGLFNTTAIDIIELIKLELLQLQQDIENSVDQPYQNILNCKISIALYQVNEAELAYQEGYLIKAVLLEKLTKINLMICDVIIQIGDWKDKIDENIASYLTQQVHKIRNHVTYSMGAIIGTETALEIAELEIDLNNFADYVYNFTSFWKVILINIHIWQGCNRLDKSLIHLSANKTNTAKSQIQKCIKNLNRAKCTISLLNWLGQISDEDAVELKIALNQFISRLENILNDL
ncbi:MAG: COG1470 family protein [Candidatus Helarchaeota archaeon]